MLDDPALLLVSQVDRLLGVDLGAVLDLIDPTVLLFSVIDHHVILSTRVKLELEGLDLTRCCFADLQKHNIFQHSSLHVIQNFTDNIRFIRF